MRLSHRAKIASKKKGGMTAFRRRTRWPKKFRLCTNMPALNFVFNLSGQQFKETNLKVSESFHELHKALFSTPTLQTLFEKQIKMIVENPETLKETLDLIADCLDIPEPPTAPSPPKHERYISNRCVKDILNISEPAEKTVTQKLAGFITSLTNRVRGVFNA